MTEGKAQVALGLSVVTITKYLMEYYSISHEEAYKKLADTDFFERLNDLETGLYLEPDQYLCKACTLELEQGKRQCMNLSIQNEYFECIIAKKRRLKKKYDLIGK